MSVEFRGKRLTDMLLHSALVRLSLLQRRALDNGNARNILDERLHLTDRDGVVGKADAFQNTA